MSTILLVGANRGIGLSLATQLAARGDTVIATTRKSSPALNALKGVQVIEDVDVGDLGAAHVIKRALKTPVDTLVVVAGILERNAIPDLDVASVRRQFEVNALGPLVLANGLQEQVKDGGKIAFLTSRMGSIADNTSGGHYGYRMSKAALNMAGRSLAFDLAYRRIAVSLLHPGYVKTEMTGGNGQLTPDESAALLIQRVDALSTATTGSFWHANGEKLPW